MRLILLAVSVFTVILPCRAQNRGLSYIGLCHRHVDARRVLRAFGGTESINIHLLIRTFNAKGCPAFDRLARSPRPMVLHISLLNGPGLRNRRLQSHEYLYGYTIRTANAAIIRRDPKVMAQVAQAVREARGLIALRDGMTTVVRVKPVLESNFSPKARRILAASVKRQLPEAEIIDNPLIGACLPNVLCETHGMDTSGDIVDLDGLDYHNADARKWEREGAQKVGMFIWKPCNNGLGPAEPWKPPLQRTNWCGRRDTSLFNKWLRS